MKAGTIEAEIAATFGIALVAAIFLGWTAFWVVMAVGLAWEGVKRLIA